MFQLQETYVENNHTKYPLLNGYDTYLYTINQKEEDRTKSKNLKTNLPNFGENPQIWVFHQLGQIPVIDTPISSKNILIFKKCSLFTQFSTF